VLDHEQKAVIGPDVVSIVADLLGGRGELLGGDRPRRDGSALHRERSLVARNRAATRVHVREVELEGAPLAGGADGRDLSPEDAGDLAADRQPEPRPAVLPAGAAVGLLEGLEDDLMLLGVYADARDAGREYSLGLRTLVQ